MDLLSFLFNEEMRFSTIAGILVFVLGFLSMGALGGVLCYLMDFVTRHWVPRFDDMHGDWVWPAMILIGMFWSLAFFAAGILNYYLLKWGVGGFVRFLAYVSIILLWPFCMWIVTLMNNGYWR